MKALTKKKRVCIALPGINYVHHSPYILSTIPVVPYLEEDFDVTVVYRKTLETTGLDYNYQTIVDQEHQSEKEKRTTHPYFAPNDYVRLWRYKQVLDQFVRSHVGEFDLVMEKEWPLLGLLSEAFSHHKIPTVLLAEAVYKFSAKSGRFSPKNPVKKIAKQALRPGFDQFRSHLRRKWSQRATGIIAETEQLKSFLIENGYATAKTPIYPIPYGINEHIFKPRDRSWCRQQLGIPEEAYVLTYVGSLNRFIQEPGPLIEALGREKPKDVVLHIVGDGALQHQLEELARQFEAPVIFHGRLPQEKAVLYIGAANLCSAPYDKSVYPDEKFTCASLKIPEYMACGRPVLTTTCERMEDLLDGERYGFLVDNQVDSYREFFRHLPSREKLLAIEQKILKDLDNSTLKEKRIVLTWRDIADLHKQVIEKSLALKY
jgi:glycosyltransferase involved in cell wall biosynthesis